MNAATAHTGRVRAAVLCDWGGSRLRAFLDVAGRVTAQASGPGIARLGGQSPATVLQQTLAPWSAEADIEVVVLCGMAGSRTGLAEVPYLRAPADADTCWAAARAVRDGKWSVSILPGIQARNFRDAADVMRGEETQIFGALQLQAALAQGRRMLVLPGTHSKWVEVRDGRIARLQTYLTGELFDLLSTQSSLLRLGGAAGADEDAFEIGVRNAARHDLAASLFETRSAQLVEDRSAGWARAFLSGLLIGAEVRSMLETPNVPGGELTLIGDPQLTRRYQRALRLFDVPGQSLDGDVCVLAGLRAAAHHFRKES
jgi:2-dehydro-3-deoxygalactonokinase